MYSNIKFGNSKKYRGRNGGKKKDVPKFKDTKGNWEYSYFQKIVKPNEEANTKKSLRFVGGFNPKKIDEYINPIKSKEELIQEKIDNGKPINSSEKIIIDNYNTRMKAALEKDINAINKFSLNANVTTDEGRKRKLLKSLDFLIKKEDINMISLIYLKLKDKQFELSKKLVDEHKDILHKMNEIVLKADLVKLQMTTLHSSQPPLDQKGFTKLDDFQLDVINNIDNNISTIVSAPTSSGKTVISGYSFTKGKTLVIVPTDVLAWQMASYIGDIIKANVPIVTRSFQSTPKRYELVELINNSDALVGTADSILDFLPLITVKFDWIVFDEIHMIGKEQGSSMEHIAKLYSDVPFLALSATIGNVEELKTWFQRLSDKQINIVKCEKRFFNLQRFVYLTESNSLERLHPLGLVSSKEIKDGSIIDKSLQPTPPDIWDLAMKLDASLNLKDLNPYKYFNKDDRITLDMSNEYFGKLVEFMVKTYKSNGNKIDKIMKEYQKLAVRSEDIDIFQMLMKLKEINKCPALVFQENSTSCMRLVRQFAKQIEIQELEKYPNLISEREKSNKKAKKVEKENEKKKVDEIPENKRLKMLMSGDVSSLDAPEMMSVQEPHTDFIFNEDQFFTGAIVEGWVKKLKIYFPNTGDDYHWLIVMLWRGVGVYVQGLPDSYLRLVQMLASSKKLAVVFSDNSLVFGVSMPFRTTIILRDSITEDTLDSMMYHQMAGRAGRRGLDKEGNVIFAGYSWNRIKELSISSFPIVEGSDTLIWSTDIARSIHQKTNEKSKSKIELDWDSLKKNFLHTKITDEISDTFYNDISGNLQDDGGWNIINDESIDHNYMVWRLRHDLDCVSVSMILPEFRKTFESVDPNMERFQINAALFLSHFMNMKEADDSKHMLPDCEFTKEGLISTLKLYGDNLGVSIPEKIDSKVYETIIFNKLLNLKTEKEIDDLRNDLFKFSEKIRHIQHYFFHTKQVTVTRLLGKLLTRIWWIYHTSSPLMKSWQSFEDANANTNNLIEDYENKSDDESDDEYENDSDVDDNGKED
jgi:hypothetical protein